MKKILNSPYFIFPTVAILIILLYYYYNKQREINASNLKHEVIESNSTTTYSSPLQIIEAQKPKIDTEAITRLSKNFKILADEFDASKSKKYRHKLCPAYINTNGIELEFWRNDAGVGNLTFNVQYAADDWLFWQQAIFLVDEKPYNYQPAEVKHDNDNGIWEWSSEKVFSVDKPLIVAIASATNLLL